MQDGKSDCLDGKETSPVDTGKGNGWRSFSGSDCAFDLCVYSRDDSVDSQSFGAVFCGKWFFLDFGREERSDFLGTGNVLVFSASGSEKFVSGKRESEEGTGFGRYRKSQVLGITDRGAGYGKSGQTGDSPGGSGNSGGKYVGRGDSPFTFHGIVRGFVNTMDSMVGYKNERYRLFGRAAAKLDDFCNFLPARISGCLLCAAAGWIGLWDKTFDGKNAWKVFLRDRRKHESPNSAHGEAACAGALRIRLAGDAWYFGELHKKPWIGDALREIEAEDVRRAGKLMLGAEVLGVVLCWVVFCF